MNKLIVTVAPAILVAACSSGGGTNQNAGGSGESAPESAQMQFIPLNLEALSTRLLSDRGELSLGYTLTSPSKALAVKLALIGQAKETIQVSSENLDEGIISNAFAEALIAAASRGVKTEVLFDGQGVDGKQAILALLSNTRNISVRVYQPKPSLGKEFADAFDPLADKTQKVQMQFNTLTVDSRVSVIGGRSMIKADYRVQAAPFIRDDYLLVGRGAELGAQAIQPFWYQAVPMASNEEDAATIKGAISALAESYGLSQSPSQYLNSLFDIEGDNADRWEPLDICILSPLQAASDDACQENPFTAKGPLTILATYPIVGEVGNLWIKDWIKTSGKVTIVGNSLSASYSLPLFASYSSDRKNLLEMGVNLYEMKPAVQTAKKVSSGAKILSGATNTDASSEEDKDFTWFKFGMKKTNHADKPVAKAKDEEEPKGSQIADTVGTKVFLTENGSFVGSLNLLQGVDNASGFYIQSKQLAHQKMEYLQSDLKENAYHVTLEFNPSSVPSRSGKKKPAYKVVWTDEKSNKAYTKEPEASVWDGLGVDILQIGGGKSSL